MENEIAVRQPTHLDMIQLAISQNADIDKLSKLMELQERYQANEAKKAYVAAMAEFKANPPKIMKDSHVKFGNTEYDHATLANVTETINSALSKHGLSAGWKTEQTEKAITVTCIITHIMGHQESTSLSSAPDNSGGKNSIQAIGSAVTYLQRYTILALTGLATHEQDDDGAGVDKTQRISEEQAATIETLIREVGSNEAGFLAYFKIKAVSDLPEDKYKTAVSMLEKKRKA